MSDAFNDSRGDVPRLRTAAKFLERESDNVAFRTSASSADGFAHPVNLDFSNVGRLGSVSAAGDGRLSCLDRLRERV